MESSYDQYSQPVHTSLMEQRQLFGIGTTAFYSLLILTIMLASIVSVYCIGIGVVGLLICRRLCKNDPLLMDFLFDNLFQSDIYEG